MLLWILIFLLLPYFSNATSDTSAQFRSPVDIPVYLSGSFGEIRGEHFHAGVDIKTNGVEGLNIYAVQDGFVSRIKISATGYGKALYIDHPNGYTTVYAHLEKFNDRIEKIIKDIQYKEESFEVDQYFERNLITVKEGEMVAFSGNSGGSFGPHLHYEIRETGTQIPVSPLAFGLKVKDTESPVLNDLFIYSLEKKPTESSPVKEKIVKNKNGYALQFDTVIVNSKKIGIGISAFDQMEGSLNKNGIMELKLQLDGKTIYQFTMNKVSFSETRYVLAHMDYKTNINDNIKVHRCFQLPGNQLSIYDSVVNRGLIEMDDSTIHNVIIGLKDFNGNVSVLNFKIRLDLNSISADIPHLDCDTLFDFRTDNTYTNEEVKISFPKYTFYDSLFFNYDKTEKTPEAKMISSIHRVHYEFEPAHKYFSLAIKPDTLPGALKPLAVVVRETKDSKIEAKESSWDGEYLVAKTRELGMYYVMLDTTAPKIKPLNVYDNKPLYNQQNIKIKIADDLSGIRSYRATVDGNWILMEYDAKNDLLIYFFDEHVKPGEHELILRVNDVVRNQSVYKINFRR